MNVHLLILHIFLNTTKNCCNIEVLTQETRRFKSINKDIKD